MISAAATRSMTVAATVAAEWAWRRLRPADGWRRARIGTIIVLGLVGYAFGIDPRILIGGAEILHRRQPGAELSNRSPVRARKKGRRPTRWAA